MSKVELVSKKEKKLIAMIMAGDDGNSESKDWSGVTETKAILKKIKPLLKNKGLYKVGPSDSEFAIYAVQDNRSVDGTYHVNYWKTESLDNYGNNLSLLVKHLAEKDIKNLVIEFNSKDTDSISKFKDNKKIMIFEGKFYNTTTKDELGNDEWSSLEMPSFDEVFKVDDSVEFKEYTSTTSSFEQEQPTEAATSEESTSTEQNIVETTTTETTTNETPIVEETVNVEQASTNEETINVDTNYYEQPVEEQTQVAEEVQPAEEVKEQSKIDWAQEFYKLRGDHNNGILSNEERFKNNRVQNAYAKSTDVLTKTDTTSLETLKQSSDNVGKEPESTYESTRRMVLENLERLRNLNKTNNEEVKTTFAETEQPKESVGNKVTTDDLLNRINEIKAKCQNK